MTKVFCFDCKYRIRIGGVYTDQDVCKHESLLGYRAESKTYHNLGNNVNNDCLHYAEKQSF